MELKGKIINFLGDSITAGSGVSSKDKLFHNLIAERYGLKKANNYGIGGTRIAHKKHLAENDQDMYYATRVDAMDPDADIIVVFGGTNDYGHGDALLGSFCDRTPDTFYGACHDLFIKLINKYPGKPIVVITPLHRENENSPGRDKMPNTRVSALVEYVDIIKEVARYYSLPVCDMYAESGIQPCVPIIKEMFCPDGLHPNDAGHVIMAEKLGGFLERL